METGAAPALKVTMQLVDPTLTVTISPLGTVSPLPVFTLTENTADDSAPDVTLLGDTVTLVVVESFFTRNYRPRTLRHRGRVDKIGTGG